MFRKISLYFIISLLCACASPSLKQNEVSQSAIEREARIQKELAQEELYKLRKRLERVELKLAPQVRELCSYLSDGKMGGCYFPVELEDSNVVNAQTDGEKIVLFKGIMRVLDKDEELAVVLGHEYAHAMLLHINKRQSNMFLGLLVDVLISGATGVSTEGAFSEIGAKAYSKDFELEADYAGLYLAHRAGYDVSQAANVWRKMAIENSSSIMRSYSSTHPSSPKRFLAQEQTYAEILNKEIEGIPLLPDKLEMVEDEVEDATVASVEAVEVKSVRREAKPEAQQERHIGKHSIAAEDHAQALGCESENGTVVVGDMVNEEYGTETYEFQCMDKSLLVECEFGNCKKI